MKVKEGWKLVRETHVPGVFQSLKGPGKRLYQVGEWTEAIANWQELVFWRRSRDARNYLHHVDNKGVALFRCEYESHRQTNRDSKEHTYNGWRYASRVKLTRRRSGSCRTCGNIVFGRKRTCSVDCAAAAMRNSIKPLWTAERVKALDALVQQDGVNAASEKFGMTRQRVHQLLRRHKDEERTLPETEGTENHDSGVRASEDCDTEEVRGQGTESGVRDVHHAG